MTTQRQIRFVHGQTAWMLGTVLALALLSAFSYELFFLLSVLGLLIVTGLTTPMHITPTWRARLKWIIVAGLVVVGAIVVRRILDILPPEVLPW